MNGVNVTDADAFGATLAVLRSMVLPSSSSVTGRSAIGAAPRFVTPAVIVMRS